MPAEVPSDEDRPERADEPRSLRQSVAALLGKLAAWAGAHRLRAVLLVAGSLISLGAVAAMLIVLWPAAGRQRYTLDDALGALDLGRYEEAREMAQSLRNAANLPVDAFGGPAFVQGASIAYEADQSLVADKTDFYRLSVRYLERARDLGIPPDREGEALFLLGRAMFLSGQLPACRPVLRDALPLATEKRSEVRRLLAEAFLHDANPKYADALKENDALLGDRTLTPTQRYQAMIQRAEILLGLGRRKECLEVLGKIPDRTQYRADALLLLGQIRLDEARTLREQAVDDPTRQPEAEEKYNQAIKTFHSAQTRGTLNSPAGRRATYLTGVCLLETGKRQEALDQFGLTARKYRNTPEALAADFQTAELMRTLGRDSEALAAYGRALGAALPEARYSNPWFSFDELRRRALAAYQDYLDRQAYPQALELTRMFPPLFPETKATELAAATHHTWGTQLLEGARGLAPDESRKQSRQGRAQLRRAGNAYARLAKMRILTERYSGDLWAAAENDMQGHDFNAAIDVLQEYLRNESRRRHPMALVYLGEAMINVGRLEGALAALEECVEFHPRDAAAYRARLLAAQAHAEQGEAEQAEALLEKNLNGNLAPHSIEWRDSLFALGQLYYQQKRYQDAVRRLSEAIRRYPHDPHTLDARFTMAECYRQSAHRLQAELEEDLVESLRKAKVKKRHDDLTAAMTQYEEVQRTLNSRQELTPLTELERKTLRNCYFDIGLTWFELGEYDKAVQAYTVASTRYQNSPVALEAYAEIARAYRRMKKPDQARASLRRAREILKRMQTQDTFTQVTNYDNQQWDELLQWLQTL